MATAVLCGCQRFLKECLYPFLHKNLPVVFQIFRMVGRNIPVAVGFSQKVIFILSELVERKQLTPMRACL